MDAQAIVSRLGGGKFIEDLATALTTVSGEVAARDKGAKGSVTVTFAISKDTDEPMVAVQESIVRRLPKGSSRGSWYFAIDGELLREDPRQQRLEFREVPKPATDVRRVDDSTAVRREEQA